MDIETLYCVAQYDKDWEEALQKILVDRMMHRDLEIKKEFSAKKDDHTVDAMKYSMRGW